MGERKVWLITSGSYSDYHVVLAFATKELADEFAATRKGRYDAYEVEEYPLLDALPGPDRVVYSASVRMINGQVQQQREWTTEYAEWEASNLEPLTVSERALPGAGVVEVEIIVRGTDRDDVRRRLGDEVTRRMASAPP